MRTEDVLSRGALAGSPNGQRSPDRIASGRPSHHSGHPCRRARTATVRRGSSGPAVDLVDEHGRVGIREHAAIQFGPRGAHLLRPSRTALGRPVRWQAALWISHWTPPVGRSSLETWIIRNPKRKRGKGTSSRFGVRWLDAAFVLRQLCFLHDSRWRSGEKERHSQSGVKPPHSKESRPFWSAVA
jgi:hypothetical protein